MAGNKIRHMKRANVALLIIAAIALVVAISLAFTFSCVKSDDKGDFSDSGRGETAEGDDSGGGSGSGNPGTGGGSGGTSSGTGSNSGASAAGELTYSLKDGSYEVTWSGKCTETGVDIPSSYEGVAVTSIGDSAFYGCSTIVSLSIPDTVTSIGDSAFYGCTSLESVTIPSEVMQIGGYAFYNCTSLTSVVLPDGVSSVEPYTFYGCTSLTDITIQSGTTSIGSYAFHGCKSLTSITLPPFVTFIEEYTFCGCSSLLEVPIPSGVTSIGAHAFHDCTSLASVTIPSGVTTIEQYTFYACSSLTKMIIPSDVTQIGSYAFYGCSSLASVTIPSGVTQIEQYTFYGCSSLTDMIIPSGVTSIGGYAFYGCSSLTDMIIPFGVTSIGGYVFYDCSSIAEIVIPSGVTSIGNYAFSGCSRLKSVTIPDNVTQIGTGAFANCTSFTDVTIPSGVTQIGGAAFSGCSSLVSMTLPFVGGSASAEAASDSTLFGYIFGTSSYTGGTSTKQYYASGSASAVTYYIPSSLASVTVTGGDIFYGAFYGCSNIETVTIGGGVTQIGSSAFSGCSSLSSITIPFVGGSVSATTASSSTLFGYIFGTSSYTGGTSTRQYYAGSSSTTYYIPSSLTSVTVTGGDIFYGAFYNCSKIEEVTIGEEVTQIGSSALSGCSSLASLTIPFVGGSASATEASSSTLFGYIFGTSSYTGGTSTRQYYASGSYSTYYISSSLTSVTVTGGDIFYGAFYGCSNITEVTVGSGVTQIGNNAFSDCTAIESVYITDLSAWCSCEFGNAYSNPLYYGGNLYLNGSPVVDLVIPEDVTSVGSYAFYGCTALKSVAISDGVTQIGSCAFCNCSSLTSITVPESVTAIGDSAFSGCTSVTEIFFNAAEMDGLSSYNNVFRNVGINGDGIAVTIGNAVTKIPSYLFCPYDSSSSPLITSVIFEDGSKCASIGSYAFRYCSSLTEIAIPDSVTKIGSTAFGGCRSLESMSIPFAGGSASATEASSSTLFGYIFGTYSYTGGTATKQYYASGYYSTYYIPSLLTSVTITGGDIMYGAFYGCSNIVSLTIGSGVTSIGSSAFYDCTSLENIYISDLAAWCALSFASANANPLYYAGNLYLNGSLLVELVIPENATSVGDYAFYNCKTLESVFIPNGMTQMGAYSFYNCTSLATVSVSDDVSSIGRYAFSGCTSLTEITIPSGVTTVGNYAFYGCTHLTEISFDAVAMDDLSANNYVFYNAGKNADGITVTVGAAVTKIPAYIFYPYSSSSSPKITTVIFEEGSKCSSIGTYAFANCIYLLSFTVPQNCKSIASNAFYNCYKLVQVYNLSSLNLTLGLDNYGYVAYYAVNVSSDYAAAGTFYTVGDVFVFYEYDDVRWFMTYNGTDSEIMLPDSVDGKNYEIYARAFYGYTYIESVELGTGTTSIGDYAFYGCTALNSVTLNEGVTSVGSYAFYNCTSLKSAIIPDSVVSIGEYAFYGCTSLASLTIGVGVTTMGEYAFYGCTVVTEISFNAVAMDDLSSGNYVFYNVGKNAYAVTVTIGAGVTKIPAYLFAPRLSSSYAPKITTVIFEDGSKCASIGNYAFAYCTSLTSVVIPGSVTKVGNYAFEGCNNLNAVYYGGTAEGWGRISFGSANTYLTSCTVYYYSDTQPSVNGNYWYFDEDGNPEIW